MTSSKETRWRQRFDNLERAHALLSDAAGRQTLSDLEAEGMVQRFEYTFELSWKTAKDYLDSQGVPVSYPREVIKAAVQSGLISTQGDTWIEMLDRRNEAAHTGDRAKLEALTKAIRTQRPGSDVDICVFGNQVGAPEATELSRKLNNETTTAFMIDVVAYSELDNSSLRHQIDQDGVVVFDRVTPQA